MCFSAARIASNLTSVGIHLQKHVDSGLLLMYSGRTEAIGSEGHLVKIKSLIREHQPRCLVIDPLSAIAKSGGLTAARSVANRFIYLAKDEQITVLVTAINEQGDEQNGEATDLQISTIADTWINLSYLIRSGERNRALTIMLLTVKHLPSVASRMSLPKPSPWDAAPSSPPAASHC